MRAKVQIWAVMAAVAWPAAAAYAAEPTPIKTPSQVHAGEFHLDEALYARFDLASRSIAQLSVALQASVGDAARYAQLRHEFDRELTEYRSAGNALYGLPPVTAPGD